MLHGCCFFFNDTATTEIYTLSLHDALPICERHPEWHFVNYDDLADDPLRGFRDLYAKVGLSWDERAKRSEEHTSELQSRQYLVCRLLLEKKKKEKPCVINE